VNDWAPRLGFSYQFSKPAGWLGRVFGEDKTVLRGGYSRTYDLLFNVAILGQDQYGSFPFVKSVSQSAVPNAVAALRVAALSPVTGDVNLLKRAMVSPDLRSSHADQFALQLQRQFKTNWVLNIGYVGTKGTALLEAVDGNPTLPGSAGRQRLDPTRGVLTLKCNCTSSIYHSLQTSVEKRLSSNFSMAAHYTWSSFIDGASDILNPSPTGEIGYPQNSFNRSADRGRSAWDRPHRIAVNGVFELPFFRQQKGALGKILGGWLATGFLTLQSGAPFSVLDGSDPGLRLSGLPTTVPANLNTNLDVSRMSNRANPRCGRSTTLLSCHCRQSVRKHGPEHTAVRAAGEPKCRGRQERELSRIPNITGCARNSITLQTPDISAFRTPRCPRRNRSEAGCCKVIQTAADDFLPRGGPRAGWRLRWPRVCGGRRP
jgi:hypothetical protein